MWPHMQRVIIAMQKSDAGRRTSSVVRLQNGLLSTLHSTLRPPVAQGRAQGRATSPPDRLILPIVISREASAALGCTATSPPRYSSDRHRFSLSPLLSHSRAPMSAGGRHPQELGPLLQGPWLPRARGPQPPVLLHRCAHPTPPLECMSRLGAHELLGRMCCNVRAHAACPCVHSKCVRRM